MKRLSSIDALRGWAIMGVVFVHSCIFARAGGFPELLGMMGQKGVMLFYEVSAFTLFMSVDSRRDGWRNFFVRRFFRIAPLFYCAILLNAAINHTASMAEILSAAVFVNGFNPHAINAVTGGGWSIAVETTFYVTIPVLFAYAKSLKMALSLLAVSLALCVPLSTWAAICYPRNAEYFQFLWIGVEFPVFVLGIVAYRALPTVKNFSKVLYRAAAALLLPAMAVQLMTATMSQSYRLAPLVRIGNLYLCSLLCCAFILAVCTHPTKFFVNPITAYIGRVSYSIYLLHFFVIDALRHFTISSPFAAFAIFFCLSIPLCTLTFNLIEKPGIRLGKRFQTNSGAVAIVHGPATL